MKFKRYTGITWSDVELAGLPKDKDSLVSYERTRKHFGLHPFHLNNLYVAVNEILSSKLNCYDHELKGFIIAYKNPKLIGPLGEIIYDACFVHIDVEVDLYIFRPNIGCSLKGIVNKKGLDHIGVLVHKAFNVSVPNDSKKSKDKEQEQNTEDEWPGHKVIMGQQIRITLTEMDPSGRLPFMRGALDARDYLSGCALALHVDYQPEDVVTNGNNAAANDRIVENVVGRTMSSRQNGKEKTSENGKYVRLSNVTSCSVESDTAQNDSEEEGKMGGIITFPSAKHEGSPGNGPEHGLGEGNGNREGGSESKTRVRKRERKRERKEERIRTTKLDEESINWGLEENNRSNRKSSRKVERNLEGSVKEERESAATSDALCIGKQHEEVSESGLKRERESVESESETPTEKGEARRVCCKKERKLEQAVGNGSDERMVYIRDREMSPGIRKKKGRRKKEERPRRESDGESVGKCKRTSKKRKWTNDCSENDFGDEEKSGKNSLKTRRKDKTGGVSTGIATEAGEENVDENVEERVRQSTPVKSPLSCANGKLKTIEYKDWATVVMQEGRTVVKTENVREMSVQREISAREQMLVPPTAPSNSREKEKEKKSVSARECSRDRFVGTSQARTQEKVTVKMEKTERESSTERICLERWRNKAKRADKADRKARKKDKKQRKTKALMRVKSKVEETVPRLAIKQEEFEEGVGFSLTGIKVERESSVSDN